MKGKLFLKIPDIAIILLFLALTGFSAYTVYIKPQVTSRVLIQGKSQTWLFPVGAEETVNVRGPLGTTVVRIHENMAWVESSPCENQTCVASGRVRTAGAWAACLPNNVLLMIEGNNESGNLPDSTAW